jgi:hypothetical protein
MAVEYCNISSDLTDVYANLNEFRKFQVIENWVKTSTTNVWEYLHSGYVGMLFENGAIMTRATDDTSSPTAGQWSYFPTEDKIRAQFTSSKNPGVLRVEKGIDWESFITRMRNDAQEEIEGKLKDLFVIPFQQIHDPFTSYNSRNYDASLRDAVATLTVSKIISAIEPVNPMATIFRRKVDLPITDPNFKGEKGFIQRILDGDLTLSIQKTSRQLGGWDIIENSSQTANVYLLLSGRYIGSVKKVWRIQIDTAGAPGTATYKKREGDTLSFTDTKKETRSSGLENRRVHLGDGVYGEFIRTGAATYAITDYWDIYLYPSTDDEPVGKPGSIRLSRD